jgi:FkbM family methyltransferase
MTGSVALARERAILPPDDEAYLVREFFGRERGFFVDVGANEPQSGSQTWHLEQLGWSGILIEPQPHLAERLRRERSSEVYAVACSSRVNSGTSMRLHLAGPMSSLIDGWAGRSNDTFMVPVRSLDEILTDARAPTPIDFLSIDVEGHACEVLDGIDLMRWRPRLILIEDHIKNLRTHRYLHAAGYRWMRRTGLDSWYVPEADARTIGLLDRCRFIRKYHLSLPFRHVRAGLRRVRGKFPLY